MFVLWYWLLALLVLAVSPNPLPPPSNTNQTNPAELAQQSRPQSDLVVVPPAWSNSLPDEHHKDTSSPLRRAVIPSDTLAMDSSSAAKDTISPIPFYSSVFPVLAYSTILAIIGFITVRIRRWRNRFKARQGNIELEHDDVELLPTSTLSLSQRFRDLPVPPPLSPNIPMKSPSLTSLTSRPVSPAPTHHSLWSRHRLSHELERPKSPVQHLVFSPNARMKRRSNSLDLGYKKRHTHGATPTPLRRPFFISEPEPDTHDDDDDDEEKTLIHFSPVHSRTRSHGHPLWHSRPNSPVPKFDLIDFSSSSSSLSAKSSAPKKHDSQPTVSHTAIWAMGIDTPQPEHSPKPEVKPSSSDEMDLIRFSPKIKERSLMDLEEGNLHQMRHVPPPLPLKTSTSRDRGYEAGDEQDEMDIAWGGGWGWEFIPSVPVTPKPGHIIEDDVVDVEGTEGLKPGQPLSAVPMSSSSSSDSSSGVVDVVMEQSEKDGLDAGKDAVEVSDPIEEEELEFEPNVSAVERSSQTVIASLDVAEDIEAAPLLLGEEPVSCNDLAPVTDSFEQPSPDLPELKEDSSEETKEDRINDYYERDDLYDNTESLTDVGELESGPGYVDTEVLEVVPTAFPPSPSLSDDMLLPDVENAEDEDLEEDDDKDRPRPDVEYVQDESKVDEDVEGDVEEEQPLVSLSDDRPLSEVEDERNDVEEGDQDDELVDEEPVQEYFPDPDLLPLPPILPQPLLETFSPIPSSASTPSPQGIPTPPASPPPGALSPVSRASSTGLLNITNRPAWSVRAADMPPLGLHSKKSAGELGFGKRNDENWDVVKRRKVKEKTKETENVLEDKDLDVVPQDKEEEKEEEKEKEKERVVVVSPPSPTLSSVGLSSPTTTSAPLPGSFPVDVKTESPSLSSPSTSTAVENTQTKPETSTALAAPKRRTATRSPIDIALAMQLRPGLGIGADPAWMVRFLMAMFGWFVVLISGTSGEYIYATPYVGARRRN